MFQTPLHLIFGSEYDEYAICMLYSVMVSQNAGFSGSGIITEYDESASLTARPPPSYKMMVLGMAW